MSTIDAHSSSGNASTPCSTTDLHLHAATMISLSLGDQITTNLATSVLPVCSEENS